MIEGRTLTVMLPKLGLALPMIVVVPSGPDEVRRIELCARVCATAMLRNRVGVG